MKVQYESNQLMKQLNLLNMKQLNKFLEMSELDNCDYCTILSLSLLC